MLLVEAEEDGEVDELAVLEPEGEDEEEPDELTVDENVGDDEEDCVDAPEELLVAVGVRVAVDDELDELEIEELPLGLPEPEGVDEP